MNEKSTAKKSGVAERVEALVTPVAEELGLYIWDVTYEKRGPDYYLTVTIDNDEGITIDDCETMHHAIDPVLDEADPIADPYMLEVSSPGIERELVRDNHFAWAIDEEIELKLFAPQDGTRTVCGILLSYDRDTLTVKVGEAEKTVERKNVSKATTVFHFTNN